MRPYRNGLLSRYESDPFWMTRSRARRCWWTGDDVRLAAKEGVIPVDDPLGITDGLNYISSKIG